MAKIEIVGWAETLENSGENILDSATAQGVPFPFSCGSGDCGACKARLLEGEVDLAPCPDGILSQQERAQGYLLACRAKPKGNIRIEPVNELVELPLARRMRGRVVEQSYLSQDVVLLRVRTRRRIDYLPGQYFNLKFDNLPARAYSVASVPSDETLEFHIRIVPDGKTSNHVARDGILGGEVQVDGPHGHGFWREKHRGPVIAIGGGTGLAPMLSIVRAALKDDPRRPIHLYYAGREETDVYCEDTLVALADRHPGIRLGIALSRATPAAAGGRVPRRYQRVTHSLAEDWSDLGEAKVYVAGPPKMVAAIAETVRTRGLPVRDLHTDPFSDAANHRIDGRLKTWMRRRMASVRTRLGVM